MPLTVNGTTQSRNALNSLSLRQQDIASAVQRLSSGKRINQAADDVAGLSIAEHQTISIRGLKAATRNTNDLISALEVTDNLVSSITNNTQRIRELAVMSANGTLTDRQRISLQHEVDQLTSENLRLAASGEFNGHRLFNIGYQEYLRIKENEDKIFELNDKLTALGTAEEEKPGLQSQIDALTATNAQILSTSRIAENLDWMNIQIGENQGEVIEYAGSSKIGDLHSVGRGGVRVIDISTQEAATEVISSDSSFGGSTFSDDRLAFDLKTLGEIRSTIGAMQNRLGAVLRSQQSEVEIKQQSRSRIIDADLASDAAKLAASQLSLQAGTAVLAQANQQPRAILQLIG